MTVFFLWKSLNAYSLHPGWPIRSCYMPVNSLIFYIILKAYNHSVCHGIFDPCMPHTLRTLHRSYRMNILGTLQMQNHQTGLLHLYSQDKRFSSTYLIEINVYNLSVWNNDCSL